MTKAYEFTTEDVEYLRHGDRGLKLRLYKPRGEGPFPAVVDLHGGAWGKGSLEESADATKRWRSRGCSSRRSTSATARMGTRLRSSISTTRSAG